MDYKNKVGLQNFAHALLITFVSAFLYMGISAEKALASESPERIFKTSYEIQMYAEASFKSKNLIKIPPETLLTPLMETEKYGGYMKVSYKNMTGWVLKADTKRYMAIPRPELIFWSNGYKIIDNVHRFFFVLRNDGTAPYDGSAELHLLNSSGRIVFSETIKMPQGLMPDGAMQLPIDLAGPASEFELVYKDGTIKGSIGKLIERY